MAPLLIGIYFFGAVQLFFIGVLGEYIGSIHTQVHKRPLVVEKERINFDWKLRLDQTGDDVIHEFVALLDFACSSDGTARIKSQSSSISLGSCPTGETNGDQPMTTSCL